MNRVPVRREQVTSADDTKVAVTITGAGPPLVVCPGSLADARDWQLVARALAGRMTSYALDRRGHAHIFAPTAVADQITRFALQPSSAPASS